MSSTGSLVYFGAISESGLEQRLRDQYGSRKIAILTDANSYEFCLPLLLNEVAGLESAEIIQIEAGEESKTLEIANYIFQSLSEFGFGKGDLLINVGGGVVTDLGGFIASIYKRGMNCIHIPTTLLGMVDASLGGKTGVNLNDYKNQIGTITFPVSTIIDSSFLDTLDQEERKSGFAEMLKHGLIADEALFNDLIAIPLREINSNLIQRAASVKLRIVEDDPFEKGHRKLLNFGHTFGHALEGALMEVDPIHHGHAVAVGILVESTISKNRGMLAPEQFERINSVIRSHYVIPSISEDVASRMYKLLWNDKKNSDENILSCLLNGIGSAIYDQKVPVEEFRRAFEEIRS